MRPVSECLLIPLRISNPPKVTQFLVFFLGGRSEPNGLFILAQTSAYRLGSKIPVVTLGNILPRVFVASVPSGLGT